MTEVHAGGYGTGYLVAPRLVLTAAHLVTRPEAITVRFLVDDVPHCGVLVWKSAEEDAVLIELDAPHGTDFAPVCWGRLACTRPGVPWEAVGFPHTQKLDGGRRAAETFRGHLDPVAGAPHGVQLEVSHPGADLESPWRGVSGAAVVCNGSVIAMVTDTMPSYGHRRLLAVPVERLLADPGFRRALGKASESAPVVVLADLSPMLVPPSTTPVPGLSPSSLLRADADTIAFDGRDKELGDLVAWCDGAGFSARLLVGPGGYGKTRLARQLGRIVAAKGWGFGIVAADVPDHTLFERLTHVRYPVLLVVDYAETRPAQVTALLGAAARFVGPKALRVLLIARSAGDWWQQHLVEAARPLRGILAGVVTHELAPLSDAEKEAIFTNALRGLATHVEGELPATVPMPDLSVDRYGSPLSVAMEALVVLLTAVERSSDAVPEDVVLDHERLYWATAARAGDIPLDPEEQRMAVAAATLCGAADETEAWSVLRRLDGLTDNTDDGHRRRRRVARWLRRLYPVPSTDSGAFWTPLQPDLLGEHLVATVAHEDATFVRRLLTEPSESQARQALLVLSRAARRHQHIAALLPELIGSQPHLIEHAIAVAPQTEQPTHLVSALVTVIDGLLRTPDSLDRLWGIAEALPASSVVLASVKLRVYEAIVACYSPEDVVRYVEQLNDFAVVVAELSNLLALDGQHQRALQGTQLAAHYFTILADEDPGRYRPVLAHTLMRLARRLNDAGKSQDATAVIDRALDIAEGLAAEDPANYEPLLAQALHTFANLFPRSRAIDSLAAIRRAVDIQERRRPSDPAALASALNTLFTLCATHGPTKDADRAIHRVVDIYRPRAAADPDTYRPDLARSLYGLAAWQAHRQRFTDALPNAEKALQYTAEHTSPASGQFNDDFTSTALLVGFLRNETGKADAVTPLVCAVGFYLNSSRTFAVTSAPYQAATLLRTVRRKYPEEVDGVWQKFATLPVPSWLTESDSEFSEEDWLRYAADCGKTDAMRSLGDILCRRKQYIEAEPHFRAAATKGDVGATERLGTLLMMSDRVEEAEEWLQKAADKGDTGAMNKLAILQLKKGDLAQAKMNAGMAANYGNVDAMNLMGAIEKQEGDVSAAKEWFQRAAAAGNGEAMHNLQRFFS